MIKSPSIKLQIKKKLTNKKTGQIINFAISELPNKINYDNNKKIKLLNSSLKPKATIFCLF